VIELGYTNMITQYRDLHGRQGGPTPRSYKWRMRMWWVSNAEPKLQPWDINVGPETEKWLESPVFYAHEHGSGW